MASHPDCFLNILKCIQDIGIYIWCDEENTYISGWQGFLDNYEPPAPVLDPPIPCANLTAENTDIITAENNNPLLTEGLCGSTTTTTTLKCKSPLEYLIELVTENIEQEGYTACEAFDYILVQQPLITIPKSENYCCPDCSNVYYLGSAENFIRFGGVDGVYNYDCCTNIFASVETYLKVVEATGPLTTCCNEFQNCIDKLFEHYNSECDGCEYTQTELDILLDTGIVEHSIIDGKSLFCELLNTYVPNNH